MDFRQTLLVLRRWALPIALAGVVAGGAAYTFMSRLPKTYDARAMLIVGQVVNSTDPDYNDLLAAQRISVAYGTIATTRTTLENVIASLKLSVTYDDLKSRVTAEIPRDSPIINIRVTDQDPVLAAAIANAIASEMVAASPAIQGQQADTQGFVSRQLSAIRSEIEVIQDEVDRLSRLQTRTTDESQRLGALEAQLAQARSTFVSMLQSAPGFSANALTLQDPAVAPETPSGPRVPILTLLVVVVALLAATGLAFVVDYMDDRVKSPDDAEAAADLATLGAIGKFNDGDEQSPTMWRSPHTPTAEAFRGLRTNLGFSSVDDQVRTLLVTSAMPGEGKTTVASNLAIAYAQAGKRVYLVDADLRRPAVHTKFSLPNGIGLSTLLRAESLTLHPPSQFAAQLDHGLRVITAGPLPPNPAEMLDSDRMRALVATLEADSDVVVLDSPPTLAATDAAILSAIADGTILVIDTSKTRSRTVVRARETLDRVGAKILGCVLNKTAGEASPYYYQYHYYDEMTRASRQLTTPGPRQTATVSPVPNPGADNAMTRSDDRTHQTRRHT